MDPLLKAIQEAVGSTRPDAQLGEPPLQQDDLLLIYKSVTGKTWMGPAHPQETRPVFSPPPPIHPPSDQGAVGAAVDARVPGKFKA